MITPRQMLVDKSKYSIKCPYDMDAQYITVHNTANDATANNEINYMIGNPNQVSFHYAIDEKEVVQGIPTNRNGWHCGDGGQGTGNRKSIGIEICYSKSGGSKYIQAEELAVKFIAQLLFQKKWDLSHVKKHQDWSGKYCPHRILSEGRWQSFLNRIQAELTKLQKPVIIPPPIYRVYVDGTKIGAFGNPTKAIEENLKKHPKEIRLERV